MHRQLAGAWFHHLSVGTAILAAAFGVAVVWLAAKLLRQRRG